MTQPPTGPEHPDQPDGGQTPQDPYGAPPPPPSYGSPYGSPSTPPPPQYGAPQPPPPTGAPYGAPTGQPHGAPYGQPGAFPASGEQGPPSRTMAILALVLAFTCCLPIGLVLGIIVLRRGKDGRDHGRGLAIAAIVVNALVVLASIALVVFAVVVGSQVRAIPDLEPGDCISGSGILTDDEEVGTITEQECTEPHDAEVMGMVTLTDEDVASDTDDFTSLCFETVAEDPERAAVFDDGEVSLLALREGREVGDTVACLAFATDGEQLEEPLVE